MAIRIASYWRWIERITRSGGQRGGNLCGNAVADGRRDKGKFLPKRQILIYPATYCDYGRIRLLLCGEWGDYLLTAGKMRDYINLYAFLREDKKNNILRR